MMGDDAEAGHSREEGTLEWQLMHARSQMVSMLRPPLPDSAVLHPLYSATLKQTQFTRASFERHLQEVRASIRKFLDEATTVSIIAQQDDSIQSKEDSQLDTKAKKQRIISLLRENASHSTAISTAARQLQRTTEWDTLLSKLPQTLSSEEVAGITSLEDARKQIQQFVQTCETMAKDLKMEAFADEHNGVAEDNTTHTHTLTLAASILVVDVEICLEQQSTGRWKPLIRPRLSYATDSTTSKPIQRDQKLAECLKIDFQAIADVLLGWNLSSEMQVIKQDCISSMTRHQLRAKKTLETLKRLDDLSSKLDSKSKESAIPDLFAALDDVGKKIQVIGPSSVANIAVGGGLTMQHVGLPYASIVYYANPDNNFTAIADVAQEMDKLTLSLVKEKPRLHFISITINRSSSKLVDSPSSSAMLPKIDMKETDDTALLYTAILHPPIVMSKKSAQKLCIKAGSVLFQDRANSRKKSAKDQSISMLEVVPSYENMISTKINISSTEDSDDDLQVIFKSGFDKDVGRQGVVVSHFSFASLQHLSEATIQLRQQVRLNDILCNVSHGSDESNIEEEHVNLQDILSDSQRSRPTSQVSLLEETNGIPNVFLNVPLGLDIWTLEVKLYIQVGCWSVDATACKIGQEHGKHSLERESNLYRESIALLEEKGGAKLKQVLINLKKWAINLVQGTVSKGSEMDPSVIDEADQVGPLPDIEKISPSREIREGRTKGRRGSSIDVNVDTADTDKKGSLKRRRSNAQSPVEDKEMLRSNSKRRASQAEVEEEEGVKRASRKRN